MAYYAKEIDKPKTTIDELSHHRQELQAHFRGDRLRPRAGRTPRTKRLVLEVYDAMPKPIHTEDPYQMILDPPPGEGPRHAPREG